jgi:hypothetical protein
VICRSCGEQTLHLPHAHQHLTAVDVQLVDRGSHADTSGQCKLVSKLVVIIRSSTMSFGVNTLVITQGGHTDERMEPTTHRN